MNLVELFEGVAELRGDGPAVTDQDRTLSYTELNTAAEALAVRLVELGVGQGERVAFCLGRDVGTFVALLGILKTGAAYVPLDPRYPAARRDLMIELSGAKLVIAQPRSREGLGTAARIVDLGADLTLDQVDPDLKVDPAIQPPGAWQRTPIEPSSLACVLFTSGSTGVPKPVALTHRNLEFFATNPALPGLLETDRMAHVSNVSFDAFHYETWCAVSAGAEIVVLPALPDLLGGDIGRELRRRRITTMLVPSMALNHIVLEDREAFSNLRVLCTGGDVILPSTCRQLFEGKFAGELYNLYGPTEATTACVAYRVDAATPSESSVPIGTPLAGVVIQLLDQDDEPVPDGTTGQLHVGGDGVALGYLNDDERTAERFRAHPSVGPERLYATGDLARRRPDGLFEFVGRADNQVKIRGYRVEPDEIERVLARHPAVRDCVVLVAGTGQDRYLIAVVAPNEAVQPRQLREHAAAELPEFMVPSSFVLVDRIPVNDHGKRDLATLRELAERQVRRRADLVPPRDDIESYLAQLWADLMSVEEVGVDEDFFVLGGNSLVAFRMLHQVGRDLDIPLKPRDILVNSQLSQLADVIRAHRKGVEA